MSVAAGQFMENAGSSCSSLKSFFPSLPTVEELCNTVMENYATARLGDLISSMFHSANTEDDEKDYSSDCIAKGDLQKEEPTSAHSCNQPSHDYQLPTQHDLHPENLDRDENYLVQSPLQVDTLIGQTNGSDQIVKGFLDHPDTIIERFNTVCKGKRSMCVGCYVVFYELGPYLDHDYEQCTVPPSQNKRKRSAALFIDDTEDLQQNDAKKRKVISEYQDEDLPASPDSGVDVSSPFSYTTGRVDTMTPQSEIHSEPLDYEELESDRRRHSSTRLQRSICLRCRFGF